MREASKSSLEQHLEAIYQVMWDSTAASNLPLFSPWTKRSRYEASTPICIPRSEKKITEGDKLIQDFGSKRFKPTALMPGLVRRLGTALEGREGSGQEMGR